MSRRLLPQILALAAVLALAGCATGRSSAAVGNYKIIYGEMGPAAQRWEIIKAAITGWEVVAEAGDEEGGVLVLHKPK
jgi:hypothetical protein